MDTTGIENLFRESGLRLTANRLLIFKELLNSNHLMSMSELEQILYPVDKSSIFRALTVFVEHSLIHSLEDGSGVTKYEVCRRPGNCVPEEHHVHFYCNNCHKTYCLETQKVPRVFLPEGFEASTVNFTIKGQCKNCSEKY